MNILSTVFFAIAGLATMVGMAVSVKEAKENVWIARAIAWNVATAALWFYIIASAAK